MNRFGQTAIVAFLSLALAGCSGKPDPVAENNESKEEKKTPDKKPKVDVAKEQKPKPKPSGNTDNKKPDTKKPDNKKPDNKQPAKGKPTIEDQLLVIINKGIAENRFDYKLDEELEKRHKDFMPILLKMAADNNMAVPQRAAAIMAIEDLLLIGSDKDKETRKKNVTAALTPVFKNASNPAAVRAAVVRILGTYSDDDPAATAALEAGLTQTDSPMVQIEAMTKLRDESMKKLLPQLIPLMRSPNPELAKQAIYSIGLMQADADAAIPEFVELLKNPKHPEIGSLLFGLGKIGTRPELTLPVLKEYTEKPDSHDWSHAAKSLTEVLVKNDLDATPYLASLKICLGGGDETHRNHTLQAFETLGPKAAPLIDTVLPCLDDKYDRNQTQAISVLKAMGPAGKPAVEELKKRLAAPDAKNREELIEALRAIVPDDPSLPKE